MARRTATQKDRSLDQYRAKRDFDATPEPAPGDAGDPVDGRPTEPGHRFVVQEHHARSLHWDLRLEHEGVLWSWAVPKGIPMLGKPNHLAVRTEDHPLEYLSFQGEIPKGEYGGGSMTVWDHGTYEPEKLRDDEVIVTLHGERVEGKYVLFRTRGDQWMIHRMSPPQDPTRRAVPNDLQPMFAVLAEQVPRDHAHWAFEMKWDGMRALATVDGGRVTFTTRQGNDATDRFPELRTLGEALGQTEVVLDGEIVALDARGVPSFEALQPRIHVSSAAARKLAAERPVAYMLFDILWHDGHSTCELPYTERRRLLESLRLNGATWQTPPAASGNGDAALATATELGLEGVVAKRLDSPYLPGKRSDAWRKIKPGAGQELVVGGWLSGNGRLEGRLGSLLVGYHDPATEELLYAGRVGSGIDERQRQRLEALLAPLSRDESPFASTPRLPSPRWVEPEVVVDVRFHEWTSGGVLRAPRFRGIRDDKAAADVVREDAG